MSASLLTDSLPFWGIRVLKLVALKHTTSQEDQIRQKAKETRSREAPTATYSSKLPLYNVVVRGSKRRTEAFRVSLVTPALQAQN
jgi:hypothetical protein